MKYGILLLLLFLPLPTAAAPYLLSPATISVSSGETFSLAIQIQPTPVRIFTASMHLSFDPTLFEMTGFTLSPAWMSLGQPGYDSVDKEKGLVIKTGGYPGGISSRTPFGSITFKARGTGTGDISISGDSILLDASSTNKVAGPQGIATISILIKPTQASSLVTSTQARSAPIPTPAAIPSSNATSAALVGTSSLAAVGETTRVPWNFLILLGAFLFFVSSVWIRYGKKSSDAGINHSS